MGQSTSSAVYIGNACLELKKVAASSGLHFIGYLLDMTALEAVREQAKDAVLDQSADRSRLIVNSICPSAVTEQVSTWDI